MKKICRFEVRFAPLLATPSDPNYFNYVTRNQLDFPYIHIVHESTEFPILQPFTLDGLDPIEGHMKLADPEYIGSEDVLHHLDHCMSVAEETGMHVLVFAYQGHSVPGVSFCISRIVMCKVSTDGWFDVQHQYGIPVFAANGTNMLSIVVRGDNLNRSYSGHYENETVPFFSIDTIVDRIAAKTGRPTAVNYTGYSFNAPVPGFYNCYPQWNKDNINVTDKVIEYLKDTRDVMGSETYEFFWEML